MRRLRQWTLAMLSGTSYIDRRPSSEDVDGDSRSLHLSCDGIYKLLSRLACALALFCPSLDRPGAGDLLCGARNRSPRLFTASRNIRGVDFAKPIASLLSSLRSER